MLLVNFPLTNSTALANFRNLYNVSPSVKLFGPYGGKLKQ